MEKNNGNKSIEEVINEMKKECSPETMIKSGIQGIYDKGINDDLHKSLGTLIAKRQQFKDDLASGKITSEEYKNFLDEVHATRNCPIRNNFNQLYGAMGRERVFIEAGKLIKGDEKVLVLVPHGTPEELNAHSIKFWDLKEILLHADFQENPNAADLKDPHYTIMDPTFEELLGPGGLIQQEIEKADIVLSLNSHDQWVVLKTPERSLDYRHLVILKVPTVKLDDLLGNGQEDVWIYVDHRLGHVSECENLCHDFAKYLSVIKPGVKTHLTSGHPSAEWLQDKKFVLMAGRFGFLVKKAWQTPHTAKTVSINEFIGPNHPLLGLQLAHNTLTTQCRSEMSK